MDTSKRDGFTLVELVIVIAVIAILAGVLIPTIGNVTDKANESAALQEARSAYELILMEEEGNLGDRVYYMVYSKDDKFVRYFKIDRDGFEKIDSEKFPTEGYAVTTRFDDVLRNPRLTVYTQESDESGT